MGVTSDAETYYFLFRFLQANSSTIPVLSVVAVILRIFGTCCRHRSYGQSLQTECGFPRIFPRDCSVKQTTTSVSV